MTRIKDVGSKGISLIKEFESFKASPYKCPAGVWTIGYGTTTYFDTKKKVSEIDKKITEKEAERLLIGHVQSVFSPIVCKLCIKDLNQNQFDALVDFCYNTGGGYVDKEGKFHYYDLFKYINENKSKEYLVDYWSKCAITANKKPLNGLIRRRNAEISLYFEQIK